MEGLGGIVHAVNRSGLIDLIVSLLLSSFLKDLSFADLSAIFYWPEFNVSFKQLSWKLHRTFWQASICFEMAKHVHGRNVVPEFNIGYRIYADTFT